MAWGERLQDFISLSPLPAALAWFSEKSEEKREMMWMGATNVAEGVT